MCLCVTARSNARSPKLATAVLSAWFAPAAVIRHMTALRSSTDASFLEEFPVKNFLAIATLRRRFETAVFRPHCTAVLSVAEATALLSAETWEQDRPNRASRASITPPESPPLASLCTAGNP